jgi:hypothetical protein
MTQRMLRTGIGLVDGWPWVAAGSVGAGGLLSYDVAPCEASLSTSSPPPAASGVQKRQLLLPPPADSSPCGFDKVAASTWCELASPFSSLSSTTPLAPRCVATHPLTRVRHLHAPLAQATPALMGLSVAAGALVARQALLAFNVWRLTPHAARKFYEGGFEATMSRDEALKILGLRCVTSHPRACLPLSTL